MLYENFMMDLKDSLSLLSYIVMVWQYLKVKWKKLPAFELLDDPLSPSSERKSWWITKKLRKLLNCDL